MPKELRWKAILIVFVLLCTCVAVYPTQDTLMWHGTVKDTVDNRGKVIKREIKEKTVDSDVVISVSKDREIRFPLAYYLDLFTGGIFHHKKDKFEDEKELSVTKDRKVVERKVWESAAGLTLGLDLAGGAEFRYRIIEHGQHTDKIAEKVIDIIRKRIDAMGLKEPIIHKEGFDRIVIQLPGQDKEETKRIQNIIESSGHLEFRLVSSSEAIIKQAEAGDVPDGYHWYSPRGNPEEKLLVKDDAELTGEFITHTGIQYNQTRELEVSLDFNAEGRHVFAKVTEENVGQRLAIILDDIRDANHKIIKQGQLYSAPVIRTAIWGAAVISGNFTQLEAEDLQTTLQAGGLPATLALEDRNEVGPSLGKDSIGMGTKASIIGAIAVVFFMLIYYRKGGLIANIALVLNVLLVVGAMAVFQATLTLPGIAGLALTIGMAVDANVLIFERIREELGKKGLDHLSLALRDGYDRAIVTIIDSNLTTVGAALCLYLVGTGTVKGFAATLSLGLLFNLFTAVFVTRVIFEFLVAKGWLHKLTMIKLFGKTDFAFSSKVKYLVTLSMILNLVALGVFFYKGDKKYDIDFRGGTMVHVVTKGGTTDNDVRKLVEKVYDDAIVQSIKGREGYSEFEIKTSRRGQANIADVKPISDIASGDMAPYAGGYEVQVNTDKPASIEAVQALMTKAGAVAKVMPVGTQESTGYTSFTIAVKETDKNKAMDLVRNSFVDLSVKADMGRILSSVLVPEGFPSVTMTPDGNVVLEFNAEYPVKVADLKTHLATWGYENPSVAVKGKPDATEGQQFQITAKAKPEDPDALRTNIGARYQVTEPFARVRSVGGFVVGEMKEKAVIALMLAFLFIIAYLWFRFELKFGVAAIIATIHDVIITMGFLAIWGVPFNLTIVAALLTIIGYSVNDTVVIFDRIRENLNLLRRERYERITDISINQTLSRTLLTSLATMFCLMALFVWGTGSIHDFALAMMVGIITGTYSSVFIAAPIVVWWHNRQEVKRHVARATDSVSSLSKV